MDLFVVVAGTVALVALGVAWCVVAWKLNMELFGWAFGGIRRLGPRRRKRVRRKGKLPPPLAETARPIPDRSGDPRIVR